MAFLREPIDRLQGDPQNVQAAVDAIRSAAEGLRELARVQRETLARPQGWTGKAQEAYQVSMDALGDELGSLADAVATKGVVVEHTGAMVRALREAVLYTVGQFSDSLVPGAITAYVFAPATFGASIAIFLGSVVDSASQLGASVAAKMDDLNAALTRQVDRVKQLDDLSDEIGQRWERFEAVAGGGEATATRAMAVQRPTEALRPMEARRALVADEPVRQPGMRADEAVALRPTAVRQADEAVALRPMAVRQADEAVALRPMESGRLVAADEAVAHRPMAVRQADEAVALRPMEVGRAVVADEAQPLRPMTAGEPLQPRHAVRESVVQAHHVEAEPLLQATRTVQAEPFLQATRVPAEPLPHATADHPVQPMTRPAEPVTYYRSAEPVEAADRTVQRMAAHRVEETE
ncbi:hypothetical protein ACFXGA_10985 [Actinosynnema sp. NPDC059335]|uniref:WXG100 family type VII secretion target n=1 Tax=Actinosynnema sp. NPDC059335 TaxID=3346804 RepID=UPI00367255AE